MIVFSSDISGFLQNPNEFPSTYRTYSADQRPKHQAGRLIESIRPIGLVDTWSSVLFQDCPYLEFTRAANVPNMEKVRTQNPTKIMNSNTPAKAAGRSRSTDSEPRLSADCGNSRFFCVGLQFRGKNVYRSCQFFHRWYAVRIPPVATYAGKRGHPPAISISSNFFRHV